MSRYFSQQTLKLSIMMMIVCIPLSSYALPSPASDDEMVHNDNYDMIMPNDEPAESMHYQNFDEFFHAEKMADDAMDAMEMDESQLSMIRAPMPLTFRERQLRGHLEELDVQREKRVQRSLAKGATPARRNVNDWEKFDYEMLLH